MTETIGLYNPTKFKFAIDVKPMWFLDAIKSGKVKLHGDPFHEFAQECTIETKHGYTKAIKGDCIFRENDGEIYIKK